MTLPLRKKHLTTAKSIRRKTTATETRSQSWLSGAVKSALLGGAFCAAASLDLALLSSFASAQQPAWQPTRIPSQSDARPLGGPSRAQVNTAQASHTQASPTAGQQQPAGVTLRWKSVSSSPAPASSSAANSNSINSQSINSQAAFSSSTHSAPSNRAVQLTSAQGNTTAQSTANHSVVPTADWAANPLRREQAVRVANYQQQSGEVNPLNDPFGDSAPRLPGNDLPPLPSNSGQSNLPNDLPAFPPAQGSLQDPAANVEPAPVPRELVEPEAVPPNSFRNGAQQDPSPFDRTPSKTDPFGDRDRAPSAGDVNDRDNAQAEDAQEDLKMPKRNRDANTTSCNDLRERVRELRVTDISLDVSPQFGGLRSREEGNQQRLDFAASAPVREWTDYTGTIVASGRMIDLRDDRVVLDVNGREQTIPLRDLSDIDVAYVAEAWNLPLRCGIGYESYAGRQFVPSAVEWKASGLCHKPLYFEDVQLERYGHEVGPVLQPLLSSAHFFGNALILPYKMGIHPPGECQYALGYYRPGNCAPYMIQPFPFSLRGAAAQAGFVTGAAALIP